MSESAFARKMLEKQGWKDGEGLGKNKDGIAKPVKASMKRDKTGVGHDPGSTFKDHWWLRVFNDAADSILKTDQTEVKEEKDSRQSIYKGFVKGSILSQGEEKKDSDCCSSDDGDDTISSSGLPTLDDLYKFCGGATGSRAGSLGIKMSGKLKRAAEQERSFNEEKNGNKMLTESFPDQGITPEPVELRKKKKKRKKKSNSSEGEDNTASDIEKDCSIKIYDNNIKPDQGITPEPVELRKKKKKKKSNSSEGEDKIALKTEEDCRVKINNNNSNCDKDEDSRIESLLQEPGDCLEKQKKRKKRKKEEENENMEQEIIKKKGKKVKDEENGLVEKSDILFDSPDDKPKKKKKKKKHKENN